MAKYKLDMNHGFIKSIVRNQVDRDNYDKEVKMIANKSTSKLSRRMKKPEQNFYRPPNIKEREKPKPICIVTFERDPETSYDLCIYENSDLQEEGKKFARTCGLCEPMMPFLISRLEKISEQFKKKSEQKHDSANL